MVEYITNFVCRGVAGRRALSKPKGVVIHNDAGSINATAKQYVNALAMMTVQQLANGFAQYYIDRFTVACVEDPNNMAWHTANSEGNANYVGYEVCQSIGASDADFRANEQETFKQVAKDMSRWGMEPNRTTVRLHQEFSATSCPHRSWALHGQSVNSVKDYYIQEIKKYMGNGNSNTTTTKPTKGRGETTMQCLYERPINPKTGKLETNGSATAVMFCNGVTCRRLYDGDEIKIIEKVYRDNNGKDIPFYKKNEWNKNNPWFVRLEAVFPVTK